MNRKTKTDRPWTDGSFNKPHSSCTPDRVLLNSFNMQAIQVPFIKPIILIWLATTCLYSCHSNNRAKEYKSSSNYLIDSVRHIEDSFGSARFGNIASLKVSNRLGYKRNRDSVKANRFDLSQICDTIIKDSTPFPVQLKLDWLDNKSLTFYVFSDSTDFDWLIGDTLPLMWNTGPKFFVFKGKVDLKSVFLKSAFRYSFFEAPLDLINCQFTRQFWIFNCHFMQNFRITDARWNTPDIPDLVIGNSCFKKSIKIGAYKGDSRYHYDLDTIHYTLEMQNDSIYGNMDLSYDYFVKQCISLIRTNLPDTLNFEGSVFSGSIDLTQVRLDENQKTKCELILSPSAADNIDLQYRYFHLGFLHNEKNDPAYRDYVESIYERLLKNFSNKGYGDSHELLDIEYKEWQKSEDWTVCVNDVWWKFGYKKSRIIWWALGLIFLFNFFNNWKFSRLQHTYPIDNLREAYYDYSGNQKKWVLKLKQYAISLLYTGLIFFKVSVDFNKMRFDKLGYAFIIILQYTIGLVCTAFLINYILKG